MLCSQNVDLVQAVISAIDGEKDPRCLMIAFKAIQVGGADFILAQTQN